MTQSLLGETSARTRPEPGGFAGANTSSSAARSTHRPTHHLSKEHTDDHHPDVSGDGTSGSAGTTTTTETFQVIGMTCGHCAAAVTSELMRIVGVTDVSVDLATGQVTVGSAQPLADADVRRRHRRGRLPARLTDHADGGRDPGDFTGATRRPPPTVKPSPQEPQETPMNPTATSRPRNHPGSTRRAQPTPETCVLDIGGMTCASCVSRVEKSLARVDGVADGRRSTSPPRPPSSTSTPPTSTLAALTAAVTKAGYTGTPAPPTAPSTPRRRTVRRAAPSPRGRRGRPGRAPTRAKDAELARLKRRWQVALTTGLALMGVMYLPLYLDTMDWLMPLILVIATAVQLWAGADIYRAAWAAAKHRPTNMNTLVALGTGVAYGYSAFVTLWPGQAQTWGLPLHLYFETA